MSDERDERAFKVEDRRRFGPDGTPRAENGEGNAAEAGSAANERERTGASGPKDSAHAAGADATADEQGAGAGEASPERGSSTSAAESEAAFNAANKAAGGKPSEITFSSFVVGLATQALMFMGAVPDPAGKGPKRNLAEAAALIDILGMLERKTAGNLAEDEARLIEDVLYDLRMRYVRETRRGAGEGNQG
ncbi:MAG TPA: DUF1844 domain-containing protein [Candidatus Limnocylindrales bacterium]|nr:DUF1844 domain-containing protein [Candidatus Limnocylindrales bacterium]